MFSMHTSPLAQPGAGDGGGMNVYVRALGESLARAGVACDVYTRAETASQPPVVEIEPGFRVLHIEAGPRDRVAKHALADLVEPCIEAARLVMAQQPSYDVLHANYWISGAVAHQLKHQLDVPLAATFHTLARVKAAAGIDDDPVDRVETEQQILACSDLVLASTPDEREQLATLYNFDRDRIEVVAPGVDHARFCPDGRHDAKRALGLDDAARVLLFVGRIQPLKGAGLALSLLHALDDPRAVLLVVGGPSGVDGDGEVARLHELVRELGLESRVRFYAPQPHRRLADFYRAADVCVVPSRTESFGLVALEAAACGTPVVAAAVGGLRSLVDDGHTGFLVASRDPDDWAAPIAVLFDDDELRAEMGVSANARARRYSWSVTAGRLRRLYGDLAVREPVRCS
jgi:D-inositol-3-phosphate glycosyltransferase